jgi:HPt (histidine-containing phosphotransfer) domain-containing protein
MGQGERIVVKVDSDIKDLIPGFMKRREEDIRSIRESLERDDYETIQMLGHQMKGLGGGYGFDTITDIGKAFEEAARDKDKGVIRENLKKLSSYLDRVEVVYE